MDSAGEMAGGGGGGGGGTSMGGKAAVMDAARRLAVAHAKASGSVPPMLEEIQAHSTHRPSPRGS